MTARNRGVKPLLERRGESRLQVVEELRRLHGDLAFVASEQIRREPMPHHSATGSEQQIFRPLRQQSSDETSQKGEREIDAKWFLGNVGEG